MLELKYVYFLLFFSLAEQVLGGLDAFLPYVKDYVETFIGKSITTQQWKEHLYAYFSKHGGPQKVQALDGVDWDVSFFFFASVRFNRKDLDRPGYTAKVLNSP
jgi:hypothetical protein